MLRSRSWSRKEPKLLDGTGAGASICKFRLQLPAPSRTKVVHVIMIHLEQDQASELYWYSFPKIMKT
jgi:hypothetical protein